MPDEIKDTWPRFLFHWMAMTLGFFLRSLLPILQELTDPAVPIAYPRWWVALLLGAMLALVGGAINSNLPCKPRELLKSGGLGFAIDSTAILAKLPPL